MGLLRILQYLLCLSVYLCPCDSYLPIPPVYPPVQEAQIHCTLHRVPSAQDPLWNEECVSEPECKAHCGTVYEEHCANVEETMCHEVYERNCTYPAAKICSSAESKKCDEFELTGCETKTQSVCMEVTEEVCKTSKV